MEGRALRHGVLFGIHEGPGCKGLTGHHRTVGRALKRKMIKINYYILKFTNIIHLAVDVLGKMNVSKT